MRLIILLTLTLALPALAQVGVVVPQSNNSSFNYDEIRTASGATCRQALGSNLQLEAGVVGSDSNNNSLYNDPTRNYDLNNSGGGVYGRITYHFGAPKRLDCARLYDLEIQSLRRQLQDLQETYVLPNN